MEHLFSVLAFAGLIAAQFLAVVFVYMSTAKPGHPIHASHATRIRGREISGSSRNDIWPRKIQRLGGLAMHRNIAAAVTSA